MTQSWLWIAAGMLVVLGAGADAADGSRADCDRDCLLAKAERFLPERLGAAVPEVRQPAFKARWHEDGKAFWYVRRSQAGLELYSVDVAARARTLVVRLTDLVSLIRAAHGVEIDPDAVGIAALAYQPATGTVTLAHGGAVYGYGPGQGTVAKAASETGERNESISPDGRHAVFTLADDLYVRTGGGEVRRLTTDGSTWRSFAGRKASSNPRDDGPALGIAPRVHWIGAGRYFYVERWDNRAVGEMWLVDALAGGRAKLVTQKFAYAGEDNLPVPELWIFDAETGSGFQVDTPGWTHIGNMDIGGGGIYPSNDGRHLYFARMTRGYGVVELCRVAIRSGRVEVILREDSGRPSGLRFVEFHELDDGFIWKSDRDGYVHYYLYGKDGALLHRLTEGPYSVERILFVDSERQRLFFSSYGEASEENPYYRHTNSVDLRTGVVTRLDTVPAGHTALFAPDGAHFLDIFARVDLPPRLVLKDAGGRVVMELGSLDVGRLDTLGWRPPVRFQVMAADGTTPLFGMMWLPTDFDPERRYPVISHVYPGPQGEPPPFGRFVPRHANAALAELGFVVVSVGQRGGASNRGRAYQDYPRAFGNMRDYPLADNKAALERLAETYTFLDLERVGVFGHSGGGFMSVAALLTYPDFYKVAVSGAGNHDNNIYEMNSGEFYFGHPRSGPAGGAGGYATNAELASRLKGRLLLVHGDMDDDVHLAHTLRLMRAFMEAGKKVDLALLPGEGHGGFSPAAGTYYRLRLWDYFLEHLAGLPAEDVDLR